MLFKISYLKELHILNRVVKYNELIEFINKTFKKLPKHYSISYIDEQSDKITICSQADIQILNTNTNIKTLKLIIQPLEQAHFVRKSSDDEVQIIQSETIKEETKKTIPQETEKIVSQEKQIRVSSNELNNLIKSKIQEILPQITKKIQSQINQSSNIHKGSSNKNIVHDRVTCDGCNVKPILGVRYKCSICHNFDYCQTCEANIQHPHAFLKIKHPSQAPKILIASLEENDDSKVGIDLNGNFMNQEMIRSFICPMMNSFVPKKQQESKTQTKTETKTDSKTEEMETKTETKKEIKIETKTEIKKEQPKIQETKKNVERQTPSEKKVQIQPKQFKQPEEKYESIEQRNLICATYLQQLFEQDFDKMLKFVSKNPHLTKDLLAQQYVEQNLY